MLFSDALYVGIDPTAGKRPMHWAALDGDLRLVAMDSGDAESALAFVGGVQSGVIAIDAPQAKLSPRELAGRTLYLTTCITCHDRGRADDPGPAWQRSADFRGVPR